ncbi:MAG TPA: dicarboxylate/amino acid:cation symporter [Gemmatimonadaceae bacterium]|nr:dicarboxylate/amino acid:cation symporter [Gemmatimonadaceae bacterium]
MGLPQPCPQGAAISLTSRVVTALVVGLVAGALVSASGSAALLSAVSWIVPLGELWVNALRMTVVPLVVAMLIGGVASVSDLGSVGRLGARTLALFLALLAGTALLALLVAPPLFSWIDIDPRSVAGLRIDQAVTVESVRQLPTFSEWLTALVPTNPIRAAADSAMLPLVIFSILFAVAIMRTAPATRKTLLDFFHALGEAMLVLVRWIIHAAPLGIFALALGLTTRLGATAAGALGLYVLIMCALFITATILLYPVGVIGGRVSLRAFAKAISPAQAVALSTRSSLASLPALIEVAETRLRLPSAISGFVLPLAVATFKMSTPITFLAGAIFLSRLYGVPLSGLQLLTIAALGVLLSFSSPGIPSGSLVIMVPVLLSVGLPPEGVGILIALDVLPDATKTILNVTGDIVVATVLSARGREATAAG